MGHKLDIRAGEQVEILQLTLQVTVQCRSAESQDSQPDSKIAIDNRKQVLHGKALPSKNADTGE